MPQRMLTVIQAWGKLISWAVGIMFTISLGAATIKIAPLVYKTDTIIENISQLQTEIKEVQNEHRLQALNPFLTAKEADERYMHKEVSEERWKNLDDFKATFNKRMDLLEYKIDRIPINKIPAGESH
jgi:hypothetical protein